jgi:hypothetical protein
MYALLVDSTNRVIKWRGSIRPIIIQSFVDDIPGVALSLVVGDLIRNMVPHGSNKCCICPGAGCHCSQSASPNPRKAQHTPTWQLAVPYQSVASQQLAFSLRQIGNDISPAEVECVLCGLGVLPFHGISRRDLPKFIDIIENCDILGIGKFAIVSC